MGGKRIESLKVRVGCKCCNSKRRSDGPDRAVEVYQLEEFEEKVTVMVGVGSPKKAGTLQGGKLLE